MFGELRRQYASRSRHLVLAGYPTPNGPLHLGHIAGPFLRGDVLRRYLRSRGHDALAVGTSDSWESNILFTAAKERRDPMAVAGDYQGRITAALADFGVVQDDYLDVHAAPHRAEHRRYSDALVHALHAEGRLRLRAERLWFDAAAGRPLVGGWLSGKCPKCAAPATGNSCEECGTWFGPTDLREPAPRAVPGLRPGQGAGAPPGGTLSAVTVTSAFAAPAAGMRAERCAERIGQVDTYLPIVEEYQRWNPAGIRLTYPIGWGVPWPLAGPDHGSVHYSYGTGLVAASKVIGDFAADRHGVPNPMSVSSDVITVAAGGLDAVMPWLVLLGLTTRGLDFRPFDFFLFNQFLDLHGAKFSTSRRHTIWVGDYVAAGLDVDCARLYLASLSPLTKSQDFRCDTFARFAAGWAERLDRVVADRSAALVDGPPATPAEAPGAVEALAAQDRCLRLPVTDPAAAVGVLGDWVDRLAASGGDAGGRPHDPGTAWSQLWTLAVLAAPLAPGWAGRLWAALGLAGDPDVHTTSGEACWRPGRYTGLRPPAEAAVRFLMDNPSLGGYPDAPTPSDAKAVPQ
ncbi:class I tRNA ligase family protein [Dactylosporangium sp. NPDC006015]|uniref:class I tRNA ligase family protein n=1 Tax=Dactylosporangium sp. NPDC006015 TaxID=3154576 RepID=UPI0033B71687